MTKKFLYICLYSLFSIFASLQASAGDFNKVPSSWKWISDREAVFSYDGSCSDSSAFAYNVRSGKVRHGIQLQAKSGKELNMSQGAVNMTYSPDSTLVAFTRDNDLYVSDPVSGREIRLTSDGSDLILNGYASWVYYEEIFGRPTRYKAFWWSPDSRKICFFRFDNTDVPLFPIYSPAGQDGMLNNTRYPKAGETNPSVRMAVADLDSFRKGLETDNGTAVKWLDFEEDPEQYFGTPYWSPDSRYILVSRMPRSQQKLELYRTDASDGTGTLIYEEISRTWTDWISGAAFTADGLFMPRSAGSDWEQIYFLSYDGSRLEQVTDGEFWNIRIVAADEKSGDIFFTSYNSSRVRETLYRTGRDGKTFPVTDPAYDIRDVVFSPDLEYFAASYSNSSTPVRVAVFKSEDGMSAEHLIADMAGDSFDPESYALPEIIYMTTGDGFTLPASVVYPAGFDPEKTYPVHIDIYGGPDTPLVRDRWTTPSEDNQWWSDNGIIQVTADCRAAGHNGRKGLDMVYRRLTEYELQDFVAWAEYFKSLPYVNGDRIGVEGFSFGGTMTAMLLLRASDSFHYGIAGGGVYDWALYDSHYTERYMGTPQNNPDGYSNARAMNYVEGYPVPDDMPPCDRPVCLKLTHGTGDDNVHFQNTLQLVDALQKAGKGFELMVYPDGMHGYSGYQKKHFTEENRQFWLRYLCR